MVEDSVLGGAIDFLEKFGFFDVILPFLLVFTIVFGVLEKTKIFGTEKIKGEDQPKKNLNAMVAFSIAFFVVAAKEIVDIIQASLPKVALILIIIISFLMLAGSILSSKEEFSLKEHKVIASILIGLIFVGVLGLFMDAIGWLDAIIDFFSSLSSEILVAIVFLLVTAGVIYYVISPGKGGGSSE